MQSHPSGWNRSAPHLRPAIANIVNIDVAGDVTDGLADALADPTSSATGVARNATNCPVAGAIV
jgi:hypothetical protein